MCDVCEYTLPIRLRSATWPLSEVSALVEGWCNADGRSGSDLVVYFESNEDVDARWPINYCPVCGRRLGDGGDAS